MKWLPPPGPQRRRQVTLLVIMLAALGVLLYRYVGSDPAAQVVNPGPKGTNPVPLHAGNLPEAVSLGKLEPVPDEPENARNLFRFGERPAPPAVRPPPAPPPVPQPPPQPPGPPPIPPIPLLLIGLHTGGDGRPQAVLKDPKTNATFMGAEGAVIDGQYKIVRVGVTSVVLTYVDGTGQRTIGLR